MKLRRFLSPDRIKMRLETRMPEPDPDVSEEKVRRTIKEQVIRELAELLTDSGKTGKTNKLFLDLWNREKKASTALGSGIAIPHVRTIQAKELVMALAIAPEGLDFGAMDGEPVYLFIALVAPAYDDALYLRVLKKLASIFESGEEILPPLLEAEAPEDVIWILASRD